MKRPIRAHFESVSATGLVTIHNDYFPTLEKYADHLKAQNAKLQRELSKLRKRCDGYRAKWSHTAGELETAQDKNQDLEAEKKVLRAVLSDFKHTVSLGLPYYKEFNEAKKVLGDEIT